MVCVLLILIDLFRYNLLHAPDLPVREHDLDAVRMKAAVGEDAHHDAVGQFTRALIGFLHDAKRCADRNIGSILAIHIVKSSFQ